MNASEPTDAELLRRFAETQDHWAFDQIVVRHGNLVMGAARRILADESDAEDVFQATFLTLTTSARKIRNGDALAAWLHQTAVRSAKNAQRVNYRWQRNLKRREPVAEARGPGTPRQELAEVLDAEIDRLPDKWRSALLLCDLEGLTRDEAGVRLGIPVATVKTHLHRARRRLQRRLVRRGVAIPATGLAVAVAAAARKSSASPPKLAARPTGRVLRLAFYQPTQPVGQLPPWLHSMKGSLAAMSATKFIATGIVAVLLLGTAGTFWSGANPFLSTGAAATILFDDFTNPNPADPTRDPISWQIEEPGTVSIEDGDMVFQHNGQSTRVFSLGLAQQDVSLRTQYAGQAGQPVLHIRFDLAAPIDGATGYQGTLLTTGEAVITYTGEDFTTRLATAMTDINPNAEEVMLQLDAFDDQIDFYVWRPGSPRPVEPTVQLTDDRLIRPAQVVLGVGSLPPGPLQGRYRFLEVADEPLPIPEPAAASLALLGLACTGVLAARRLPRRPIASRCEARS